MNIEKIEINGHYVWVDKEADIKEGELCIDGYMNILPFADLSELGLGYDKNTIHKIIAASPELNLEGVPTYFEWLFENQKIELDGGNLIQVIKDVFIKGYQAAEKELPTWDDVAKAIEMVKKEAAHQLCPKCNGDGNLLRYNSPAMMSTTVAPVCDVCWGNKIIPLHNLLKEEEIIEQLKQDKQ